MERLKRAVRKAKPFGPRCFKWMVERLSGPRAGEFLQDLIASATSRGVKVEKSGSS